MRTANISAFILIGAAIASAQMAPDRSFDANVTHPQYASHHPRVAIDQAHHNIHTKDGLFKPFADLLRSDGYEVVGNNSPFTSDHLKGIDVLVVANASGTFLSENDNSTPAFTSDECDVVYDWVRHGGSLFLAADHAPMGDAAAPLATRFGVTLGNGFVVDSNPSDFADDDPTELVFSDENHLLGRHPIIRGGRPGNDCIGSLRSRGSRLPFRQALSLCCRSRRQQVSYSTEKRRWRCMTQIPPRPTQIAKRQ